MTWYDAVGVILSNTAKNRTRKVFGGGGGYERGCERTEIVNPSLGLGLANSPEKKLSALLIVNSQKSMH